MMTPATSFDLRAFESYEAARDGFAWDIPVAYNIAADVSDRFAQSDAVAARCVTERGVDIATFADLAGASSRLASSLSMLGLGRGSHICMVMADRLETLVTFLAIAKLGAVAVTLRRYDTAAPFEHELKLGRADAVVCDASLAELVRPLVPGKPFVTAERDSWPRYQAGDLGGGELDLVDLMIAGDPAFPTVETSRDDPVLVSFTSGSTGLAKGVVQPHRVARGAVPAFQMVTDLGPCPGDVFFSNLGWSTMGALRSIVLPAWQFEMPVVGVDVPVPTTEAYCDLLTSQRVSVAYLMPDLLKRLRQLGDAIHEYDWSALRVVISSGEGIGAGLREWIEGELGLALQAYYGQTEVTSLISTCRSWFPVREGTIGRIVPGHAVELVETSDGTPASDTFGAMVIPQDDPGLFLGYLTVENGDPDGLAEPYATQDVVRVDDDGYFYYLGRDGDVIVLPSGRVVAAAEIEDAVGDVPGVLDAAVITGEHESSTLVMCIEVGTGAVAHPEAVAATVRDQCALRLPADAVPDDFVVLTTFPKTKLTNKVNRSLLRTMVGNGEGERFGR